MGLAPSLVVVLLLIFICLPSILNNIDGFPM
jgi:hypothetical protein